MTSSTKPEIHNLLHYHQPTALVIFIEKFLTFGYVVLRYGGGHTDNSHPSWEQSDRVMTNACLI